VVPGVKFNSKALVADQLGNDMGDAKIYECQSAIGSIEHHELIALRDCGNNGWVLEDAFGTQSLAEPNNTAGIAILVGD
jgi:hypothetical protein